MIAHYDIIQGSEDWHILKHGKIGGTLSKGLFVDSDTLLIQILAEQTEDFQLTDDSYENYDMLRGKELEPMARIELSKYIGFDLLECGWLECEEYSILGISPDGISLDHTVSCEIKCPARNKHMSTLCNDEIPSDNIYQCLQYFVVNPKLEQHHFLSFRPENKLKPMFIKTLKKDSIINMGTKAKPKLNSVSYWVEIAHKNTEKLIKDIAFKKNQLSF